MKKVLLKKVLLIILDGFGLSHRLKGNAIANARMPFYHSLLKQHPHTILHAAGKYVGLLKGYIGNSEVGHLHIGAGRLVQQDLRRIFDAIDDKSFFENKAVLEAIKHVKQTDGTLHLMGLLSDAGVHSHYEHLFALIRLAKKQGVKSLAVHAFLDGRDVAPMSAEKYLRKTEQVLANSNRSWKIATITGRFYAMDRDKRWHRTREAYDMLTGGNPTKNNSIGALSSIGALKESYRRGRSDEFVFPTRLTDAVIRAGDSIVFFNYRADRARQLTHAFVDANFTHFARKKIRNLFFATMASYEKDLPVKVIFQPEHVCNTLGAVVSKAGLKQFRLAETEKWAHVTFFFNGLTDKVFKGEHRMLVPSPKVRTYDKTPRMSAGRITAAAMANLHKNYALMVVNYANPDMIGHTGKYVPAIKANEFVDACLSRLVPLAQHNDYAVIITADHGNAEEMNHADGSPCTSHTRNDVPFILISDATYRIKKITNAALYHIAPTVLDLMGIKKPKEMINGILI